jgi:hypothetical protein
MIRDYFRSELLRKMMLNMGTIRRCCQLHFKQLPVNDRFVAAKECWT